jgi:hypothetical protein
MDESRPPLRTRGARWGARVKSGAGGMTTVEGGRGAIKKRTVQIEKRRVQRPATKVSMMGAADNGAGSGQQSREGHNNQPSIGAVKASSG